MVAAKTDYEIANTLADAYAQNVLVSPIIEVRRAALGPQNIIVGGEVNNPGLVELTGPVGALEAILMAGGLQNSAARGDVEDARRRWLEIMPKLYGQDPLKAEIQAALDAL